MTRTNTYKREKSSSHVFHDIDEIILNTSINTSKIDAMGQLFLLGSNCDETKQFATIADRKVLSFEYDTNNILSNPNKILDYSSQPLDTSLSEQELAYVINRLPALQSNSLIHGFYCDVLTTQVAPDQTHIYATMVVADYLATLKNSGINTIVDKWLFISAANHFSKFHIKTIESEQLHVSDVKETLLGLLLSDNNSLILVKRIIVELSKTKFISGDNYRLFIERVDSMCPQKSYFDIEYLRLLANKAEGLHINNAPLYEMMACCCDEILCQHHDPIDFIYVGILQEKACYYKKAKNDVLYNQTMSQLIEAKKANSSFQNKQMIPVDLPKSLNDVINGLRAVFLEVNSFEFMATYVGWFMNKEKMQSAANGIVKDTMLRLMSVSVTDINGNCQKGNADSMMKQTVYEMSLCVMKSVVIIGLEEKINRGDNIEEELFEYLNRTWLNERMIISGHSHDSSWIDILRPGLRELCSQLKVYHSDRDAASFVLCIDSLVLKIEGCLRELLRLKGISSTSLSNDVPFEITLENILNQQAIENL